MIAAPIAHARVSRAAVSNARRSFPAYARPVAVRSAVSNPQVGTFSLAPETGNWLSRLPASPQIERRNVIAVDRLIKAMKAADLWYDGDTPRWQHLYLPADTLAQSLVNVAAASTARADEVTPVYAPDRGWLGDSTTGAFTRPGLYFTEADRSSMSLFVWVIDHQPGATYELGATGASRLVGIRVQDNTKMTVWTHTASGYQKDVNSGLGYSGFSRIGGDIIVAKGRGSETATVTTPGLCTGQLLTHRLGGTTDNSIGSAKSPALLGPWGKCSPGLTADEHAVMHDLIFDFLFALDVLDEDPDPGEPNLGTNVFTPAMAAQVTPAGMHIIQQFNPPASDAIDETTYARFPITRSFVQYLNASRTSTWTGGKVYHLQWIRKWQDRENPGRQYNVRPTRLVPTITTTADGKERAQEYITTYSSPGVVERYGLQYAQAADVIHTMWMCGYSDADIVTYAQANGYPDAVSGFATGSVLTWSAANTRKDDATLFEADSLHDGTQRVSFNKVILPRYRFADFATSSLIGGIRYDAEMQDGAYRGQPVYAWDRNAAGNATWAAELAAKCKGAPTPRECHWYGNPVIAVSQDYTHWDETNLPGLIADPNVDSVWLVLAPPGTVRVYDTDIVREFSEQLAKYGLSIGDSLAKMSIVIGLGAIGQSFQIEDAQLIRPYLVATPPHSLDFWPYYYPMGGDATNEQNQVIAYLCGLTI